ncbi:AMP nucleosidase, partial [Proteus mirabilis]
MSKPHNPEIQKIINELKQQYQNAVDALRNAIIMYAQDGKLPDIKQRAEGLFAYPQLTVHWYGDVKKEDKTRAYGRLSKSGTYSTTITNPTLFENYLTEQLQLIADAYHVSFEVTASKQEIPYPFVIDGTGIGFERSMSASLAKYFPTTDLSKIGDDITDGLIDD